MKYCRILVLFFLVQACSPEPAAEQERAIERIPSAISVRAHSELLWSNKDVISVFDAELRKVDFRTSRDNVPSATFSSSSWTGKAPVYAVFCSSKDATTCTPEGVMGVFIKSGQKARDKGTSPDGGGAAVGTITGSPGTYDVEMKNVCAFIKLTLKTGIVGKISASAPGAEAMNGYVDVDYAKLAGGEEAFWVPSAGKSLSSSVSLVPGSGTCFEKGDQLISILPGTYSKGINLSAYDDEGFELCAVTIGGSSGIKVGRNENILVTINIDSSFEFSGIGIEGVTTSDKLEYDK